MEGLSRRQWEIAALVASAGARPRRHEHLASWADPDAREADIGRLLASGLLPEYRASRCPVCAGRSADEDGARPSW